MKKKKGGFIFPLLCAYGDGYKKDALLRQKKIQNTAGGWPGNEVYVWPIILLLLLIIVGDSWQAKEPPKSRFHYSNNTFFSVPPLQLHDGGDSRAFY